MCSETWGKILAVPTLGLSMLAIDKKPSASSSAPPPAPAAPPVPEPEVIKDQAREEARRRQAARTPTVLTSGVGLIDEPATAKKTLLGA